MCKRGRRKSEAPWLDFSTNVLIWGGLIHHPPCTACPDVFSSEEAGEAVQTREQDGFYYFLAPQVRKQVTVKTSRRLIKHFESPVNLRDDAFTLG